jgi:hypothetical protein
MPAGKLSGLIGKKPCSGPRAKTGQKGKSCPFRLWIKMGRHTNLCYRCRAKITMEKTKRKVLLRQKREALVSEFKAIRAN